MTPKCSSRCVIAVLSLAFSALAGASLAAPAKPAKKDTQATPVLVASYGDWGVYDGTVGKGKICYLLATPKDRTPNDPKRDKSYAFISDRPAEGVKNEVSFIMGVDIAPFAASADKGEKADKKKPAPAAAAPLAVIADETFDLLPKGSDLWIKNPANEGQMIDQMRKGITLVVKATAKKGGAVADTYALTGFSQAMDRLQKECAGK